MSTGSIAAVAASSLVEAASPTAMQPTAQQAARFQQQLNLPDAASEPHYAAPAAQAGLQGNLRDMVEHLGQLSHQLGTNLEGADTTQLDVGGLPPELQQQLQLQREFDAEMSKMNNVSLSFTVIGKSVELTENVPKVLYQQG
jgi:hypothetical protein